VDTEVEARAALHAALGDPLRLAIVDELVRSDRTAAELSARFGLAGNLLAHHLAVLERADLIARRRSSGDHRRRYVHVRAEQLRLAEPLRPSRDRPRDAVFVCTRNSARSQMAAALWSARTGRSATSAGTEPSDRVHPLAIAAAAHAGLDLGDARPRALVRDDLGAELVITVCDLAHERIPAPPDWLHWSIADPAEVGTPEAFEAAFRALDERISWQRP
jgi:protein-tyrosine-phosphatase/DNA-binding transcriptional ArsR family regulator